MARGSWLKAHGKWPRGARQAPGPGAAPAAAQDLAARPWGRHSFGICWIILYVVFMESLFNRIFQNGESIILLTRALRSTRH